MCIESIFNLNDDECDDVTGDKDDDDSKKSYNLCIVCLRYNSIQWYNVSEYTHYCFLWTLLSWCSRFTAASSPCGNIYMYWCAVLLSVDIFDVKKSNYWIEILFWYYQEISKPQFLIWKIELLISKFISWYLEIDVIFDINDLISW